jgi:hypothetical protein
LIALKDNRVVICGLNIVQFHGDIPRSPDAGRRANGALLASIPDVRVAPEAVGQKCPLVMGAESRAANLW